MSSFDWIHVIWLVVTLAVMISAYSTYNIGLRRSVIMALVWVAIFLVATGLVWLVAAPEPVPVPQGSFDPDAPFI